mmetsp:Transcript_30598/g.43420  ORF Transcript_30598/g.43420 Transcript_30598/m.43420 type:complete len:206 (-) Transcript_30598:221-838(-)
MEEGLGMEVEYGNADADADADDEFMTSGVSGGSNSRARHADDDPIEPLDLLTHRSTVRQNEVNDIVRNMKHSNNNNNAAAAAALETGVGQQGMEEKEQDNALKNENGGDYNHEEDGFATGTRCIVVVGWDMMIVFVIGIIFYFAARYVVCLSLSFFNYYYYNTSHESILLLLLLPSIQTLCRKQPTGIDFHEKVDWDGFWNSNFL